jgi:ribonuclease E
MPNTARGGGISRKITDAADRQRLKSIAQELEVPEGMGVILRTAGASRTKAEVKRDFEYLLRMWETVREMTLRSTAPTLVYEEGSLIKRAIRDLYNKDIDEIIVSGENGYREAKEFMRMLMPSHAKAVQPYRDPQPIFAKAGAEAQLDAMFSNQVTLKSGGYLVINQAEALVAIDVNSGRSTREHNIEDTAVRTNLEAADEVARQLRLRDLAGLIVVDFIDMEESRNNRAVERRLKEALKNDRARIQVGRISHFGLLEMSRQRMRTGVLEGSTVPCPHCAGAGMVRSTASIALHVLRVLEDALIKNAAYDVIVNTRTVVALYILNQKRVHLRELEQRFGVSVTVAADDSLTGTTYHALERGELASGVREIPVRSEAVGPADFYIVEQEEDIETEEEDLDTSESMGDEAEARQAGTDMEGEGDGEGDGARRRRRRRRRRGGRGADREGSGISANAPQPSDDALGFMATMAAQPGASTESEDEEADEAAVSLAPEEAETEANGPRKRSRKSGRAPREMAPSADESEAAQAQDVELEIETEQEVEIEAVAEDMQPAQGRRPRRVRSRGPRRPAADLETEAKESEARPEASPVEVISDVSPGEPPAGIVFPVTGDEVWPVPAPQALPESAQVPILATAEADSRHAPVEEQTHIPAEALVPAAPAPVPAAEPDPARPKRSGWWQRAKATLRG